MVSDDPGMRIGSFSLLSLGQPWQNVRGNTADRHLRRTGETGGTSAENVRSGLGLSDPGIGGKSTAALFLVKKNYELQPIC